MYTRTLAARPWTTGCESLERIARVRRDMLVAAGYTHSFLHGRTFWAEFCRDVTVQSIPEWTDETSGRARHGGHFR